MIAEAIAAACRDATVLARIGGPIGDAARARAAELAALPGAAGRARRVAWAAAARAQVPAGLRGIHPTWIEAALAELPTRARHDIASGSADPVSVWLARWASAELPPMPPADLVGVPRSITEAVRMRADELTTWLEDVGADQLALALGAAGGDAVRAATRIVGDRLRLAAARIGRPPRAGSLGPPRAAIARSRVPLDASTLLRIGARTIAPHVDTLVARQLAIRLPRVRGLVVQAELRSRAGTPGDPGPTWAALGAP